MKKLAVKNREKTMLLVNTESVPGRKIASVLGLVGGSTVRTKHIGRDIAASLKNLVGGELKGYTANQIVVRTSTYAKFAAWQLPKTKGTIVGMATRFVSGSTDTWQIMIRKESDINFPEE